MPNSQLLPITVLKLNHLGQQVFTYSGEVLHRDSTKLILEARFGIEYIMVDEIELRRGDRFVETYYTDRWYNLYEIRDRDDDHFKGWYCNISHPAVFTDDTVSFRDLALDLLVYPDGRQLVLDREEFDALSLSPEIRASALNALAELQSIFTDKKGDLSGLLYNPAVSRVE